MGSSSLTPRETKAYPEGTRVSTRVSSGYATGYTFKQGATCRANVPRLRSRPKTAGTHP